MLSFLQSKLEVWNGRFRTWNDTYKKLISVSLFKCGFPIIFPTEITCSTTLWKNFLFKGSTTVFSNDFCGTNWLREDPSQWLATPVVYDTVYANQNLLLQHIHISIFASGKFLLSPSWKLCEAATRHNRSNDSVVSVSQGKKRLQVNCKLIVQTAHFIFEKNYHCIVAKCPNSLGLNKTLYLTLKQRD